MLHICTAQYLRDYQLEITFNNGQRGIVDLQTALYGAMFAPLRDVMLFTQFTIDKELATIVWSNGADLAPEYLYYQAFKTVPELQQQFQQWGYI